MPESNIIMWIACAFGAIILIGSVSSVLVKMLRPFTTMKKQITELELYKQSQKEISQELLDCTHLLCKVMFTLLDHEITGNSIEKLKNVREDLKEYLIKK